MMSDKSWLGWSKWLNRITCISFSMMYPYTSYYPQKNKLKKKSLIHNVYNKSITTCHENFIPNFNIIAIFISGIITCGFRTAIDDFIFNQNPSFLTNVLNTSFMHINFNFIICNCTQGFRHLKEDRNFAPILSWLVPPRFTLHIW